MLNPSMIRNMVMGMGGAGGLLAADDADAAGSSSLSAVEAIIKQMRKGKYKDEGETGRAYKWLKQNKVDFNDFKYVPGDGGNYGDVYITMPDGSRMKTTFKSTSPTGAAKQLNKVLVALKGEVDPKFLATDGSQGRARWTKVGPNDNNGVAGLGLGGGLVGQDPYRDRSNIQTPNMDRLGLSKQYDPEKVQSIINFGKDGATDPAMMGEVIATGGLKLGGAVSPYIKGFGASLLLDSGDADAAEVPGFQQKLQRNGLI